MLAHLRGKVEEKDALLLFRSSPGTLEWDEVARWIGDEADAETPFVPKTKNAKMIVKDLGEFQDRKAATIKIIVHHDTTALEIPNFRTCDEVLTTLKLDPAVKDECTRHLGLEDEKSVVSTSRNLIFEKLEVEGLGPFSGKEEFDLNHIGLALITANVSGLQSNGFGKTMLCTTSILWCLTGSLDRHPTGSRKLADLKHDKIVRVCLTGKVFDGTAWHIFEVLREKDDGPNQTLRLWKDGEEITGDNLSATIVEMAKLLFGINHLDNKAEAHLVNCTYLVRFITHCFLWSPPSDNDFLGDKSQRTSASEIALDCAEWQQAITSFEAENKTRIQKVKDVVDGANELVSKKLDELKGTKNCLKRNSINGANPCHAPVVISHIDSGSFSTLQTSK
jgi:hypothetical protein